MGIVQDQLSYLQLLTDLFQLALDHKVLLREVLLNVTLSLFVIIELFLYYSDLLFDVFIGLGD